MAQGKELVWDETGKKLYETGVSKGVLYPQDDNGAYPKGVAWNGLSGVTESPSGAEATAVYADNIKYLNLRSAEEFKATVEAYMYPDEFAECDGSKTVAKGVTIGQQPRKSFGLCYKTIVGNDVKQDKFGYKLHFVYGATAALKALTPSRPYLFNIPRYNPSFNFSKYPVTFEKSPLELNRIDIQYTPFQCIILLIPT